MKVRRFAILAVVTLMLAEGKPAAAPDGQSGEEVVQADEDGGGVEDRDVGGHAKAGKASSEVQEDIYRSLRRNFRNRISVSVGRTPLSRLP